MRLIGKRVILRDEPISGDDEDRFRWLNMEDWAYYDRPDRPFEPATREEYEARLGKRDPGRPGGVWKALQIDAAGGEHIGWINCYDRDEVVGTTRVGICLPHEANRGRGLGTEALTVLLGYLFAEKGFSEVRLNTWTGNAAMVRCALKAGFEEVSRSPHRAPVSVRGEALERIDLAISWSRWDSQRDAGE